MEKLDYQIISMDTDLSEKYIACGCSDKVVRIVRICTFINGDEFVEVRMKAHS